MAHIRGHRETAIMPSISLQDKVRSIAIIGGGPAASAFAIALRQQAIETDIPISISMYFDTPQEAWKIGESLNPSAIPILQSLGILDSVYSHHHRPCPGNISLWNDDRPGHHDFLFSPAGHGLHLDRILFEESLRNAASDMGIQLFPEHRFKSVDMTPNSARLSFTPKGEESTKWHGDFVIDATGKAAHVARKLGVARNLLDEVLFICLRIPLLDGLQIPDHSMVEAVENGWWYATRTPDDHIIVTFCTDQETLKSTPIPSASILLKQLEQTIWLKTILPVKDISHCCHDHEITIRSAPSSILSNVVGECWLAIGDAASSYDPITSAGISKALQQGSQAGNSLFKMLFQQSENVLAQYQDQVFSDFNHYLTVRHGLYSSEKRFQNAPFWRRRLGQLL